jgi:hypothetical protein
MVPTLFPPHCAVILSGALLGVISPAKPNCLQRARNVEKYCMWSQVFVVQPLDFMEFASGVTARRRRTWPYPGGRSGNRRDR